MDYYVIIYYGLHIGFWSNAELISDHSQFYHHHSVNCLAFNVFPSIDNVPYHTILIFPTLDSKNKPVQKYSFFLHFRYSNEYKTQDLMKTQVSKQLKYGVVEML